MNATPGRLRLSAIVPTWNEAARLGAVLRDLRALDLAEILVVDGGSADATVAIARAVPGARVISAARGRASQLNAGAAAATGDVLWFVHADARVPIDATGAIRRALADPSVVAGAFRIRTVAEGRRHWAAALLPLADLRSFCTRRPYGDQALFVRASAFRAVGGFAPIRILEDVDLAARLWAVGRVVTVPERIEVSGRRFLARPLYYAVVMNTFPTLYRLGVSSARLERWYGHPR